MEQELVTSVQQQTYENKDIFGLVDPNIHFKEYWFGVNYRSRC